MHYFASMLGNVAKHAELKRTQRDALLIHYQLMLLDVEALCQRLGSASRPIAVVWFSPGFDKALLRCPGIATRAGGAKAVQRLDCIGRNQKLLSICVTLTFTIDNVRYRS